MMFLFAGHSDKPLKSLISMAHEENHICLHRFSFIYVMDDLREDVYTCPINVMDCTTESAIYVMGLTVVELRMFFSKLTTNSSAFIVSN